MMYKIEIEWITNPFKWLAGGFTWLDGSRTIGIGPLKIDFLKVHS